MEAKHDTVLLSEAVGALSVREGDTIVDATLGGAGHFGALLALLGSDGVIIGIDADPEAVERARAAYAADRRESRPIAHLVNDNFRNLARVLERLSVGKVNGILFDLGWSGFQVAAPRGFSFQRDEPLLMAYGEGGETAADIVNTMPEAELADLIFTYGEEHFSRGIARAIVEARSHARILTTGALVEAIKAGTPRWYHHRRIHPATKTFQALRIAVNDELGALRDGLQAAIAALTEGGKLAVISFHSIEDRIVKNMLREAADAGLGALAPKKPIVPTSDELKANPRARSAKLRVFERSAQLSDGASFIPQTQYLTYA